MSKDDRSAVNPFTGKKELDLVDDDQFLAQCYNEYYQLLNKSQLMDNTEQGQLINKVVKKLINSVHIYLSNINRLDYVEDYYDWEVHLINSDTPNAFCMPGGKIAVLSGILPVTRTEADLAFILGHEISHALLDHSRTQTSKQKRKAEIVNAGIGVSTLLNMFGMGGLADLTYATSQMANMSSDIFFFPKHSRDHESQADRLGMILTHLAGYDIRGIPEFWQRMSEKSSNEFDIFSSHPADSKRIKQMNEIIEELLNSDDMYHAPLLSDEFKKNNKEKASKKEVSTKLCGNCGAECSITAKFCGHCGNKLS